MFRYKITSKFCALIACSALLTAAIGCSPGTPTAPSLAPQNVVENPNFIRILSSSEKGVQGLTLSDSYSSMMISAEEGGVLSNGRVTLEFPPHALSEDTEISIMMLDDGTLGVELGPHGVQFSRSVTLTMDLSGTSAEGHAGGGETLWWNDGEMQYERMMKVDLGHPNQLSASLDHFSKYHGVVN